MIELKISLILYLYLTLRVAIIGCNWEAKRVSCVCVPLLINKIGHHPHTNESASLARGANLCLRYLKEA